MSSLTTPTFDLVKCRRSQRQQLSKLNSKAIVPDAGFCIFQMPAFPLPALSSTSGIILDAILILFYFFLNNLYPYKTRKVEKEKETSPNLKEENPRTRLKRGGSGYGSTLAEIML